ncbi:MAG: oligosaccharide flippase family protein [Proteobacteria bacterium]|nr:oligosaccharide flippase family protein [Pseudomonadota bacterium]
MAKLPENLIYTILTRCITLLSSFLVSIFTAHYLGPSGRGDYFFVSAFSTILVQFGCLGMHSSSVFLVAKKRAILGGLVGNALWACIAIGFFATICAIVYNQFYNKITGIVYIIILTPASLFYLLATNLLVGIKKTHLFNFFQLSSNLSVGIILLICGLLHLQVNQFLAATTLVWLIHAVALFIILFRGCEVALKFNLKLFKKGFLFGLKSYLASFFSAFILQGNVIILRHFVTSHELGYYSIAQQISFCLTSFPAMCALLLFPDLVQDPRNRWTKTKKALLTMGGPLFFLYLLLMLYGKTIIPVIFGQQFIHSTLLLQWMLPGSFLLGITSLLTQYIISDGFPNILVSFWIIGFITMLTLSSWLIPAHHSQGAAMSFSLAYTIVFLLVTWLAYQKSRKERLPLVGIQFQKKDQFSVL